MDRMRALEVFVAVAEAGSLAGAARALSISAPSVTRVLGEYESELGVLLFHRTTRALTLTDDGNRFLVDARDVLARYQDASDAVRGAHRAPKGTLRITASNLFGQHYILPLLLDYMAAFPAVKADAVFLDRVVNLVEERFDLAVRIGLLADSSLIATRVGTVRSVVCGSSAYLAKHGVPSSPDDLVQHSIVLGSPMGTPADWRFKGDVSARVDPRLTVSSIPAAIAAAKAGWGLTRVLSYQIGPELGDGGLNVVLAEHEPEPVPIHLVHAEGRSASAKVRAFVDLARDRLRANPFLNP